MNRLKPRERIVDRDQILPGTWRHDCGLVERYLDDVATSALVATRPSRIDENSSHRSRGHREEMRSVLPLNLIHVDQPEIRFIHEGGSLKRVAGSFAGHVPMGEAVQLIVDKR